MSRTARATTDREAATRAILNVGAGRGFVIEVGAERYVITAAHCLPFFPPCMSFSHTHERTYAKLIGPLGENPTAWAECLFVDPIGDVAVLGEPDGQVLPEEWEGYEALIENASALRIGDMPELGTVWLLGLDGRWMSGGIRAVSRGVLLVNCDTEGGMSGSPILTDSGVAMGMVTMSAHGSQARLTAHLPGWLLR